MTFATLNKIHTLLKADVQAAYEARNRAVHALEDFEAKHDLSWHSRDRLDKVPEEIRYMYQELTESKTCCYDMYKEAANALADFEQHDWH